MNDSRIKKLQRTLSNVDGCLIEKPVDLLYLTGLSLSKGRFWATSKEAILFVDGRYYERAKKAAPCTVVLSDEKSLKEALGSSKKVGFDGDFCTYENFLFLKRTFPEIDWIGGPSPLKEIRACKEPAEILALKRAAQLTWEGYQFALGLLKEGITEREIGLEFEIYCRKKGASGFSFDSIIAFGESSAYPHYRAAEAQLRKDQIVLMDIGAIVDLYHADMTRVSFFGNPDSRLLFFEEIVRRAHDKVLEQVRPGIAVKELDRIAREEFRKEGVEQFFVHSLGHGVGLETHEYPLIRFDGKDKDVLLKSGMIFTVEPGLYQPGVGGVRYENMILVTEKAHENLLVL